MYGKTRNTNITFAELYKASHIHTCVQNKDAVHNSASALVNELTYFVSYLRIDSSDCTGDT